MTKEKLEKEAVEYAEKINLQNVNISGVVRNHISQAYLASAEPREKRIEELTKWLSEASDEKLKLQMLRVDLVSKIGKQEKRIAELEAQIEKMKCCYNCANDTLEPPEVISNGICEHCKNHDKWELAD